jgi:methylase of polypeptide subunit release factors
LALDGGSSGLKLIIELLIQAKTNLTQRGAMFLEIESSLGEESLDKARKIIPESQHRLHQDLSGKDRVLEIRLK